TPPVYSAPASLAATPVHHYAGFWIRFLAYLIDGVILGITGFFLGLMIGIVTRLGVDHETSGVAGGAAGLLNFVLGFLYFTMFWSSAMQASLGQKICGLSVITTEGEQLSYLNAVGRYFGLVLSFLILCIGVLMVAFTERKQGLHDMLAGTYVIKSP
ncbi:MAG TPA: RDD family protein, partial [Chthoniobacterales bacterium]|nr:RDD family protein [Chthoniobacterales bacterium]